MDEEQQLTVLMADLAGYTALTEAHGSAAAAHVVARYLELAEDATAPGARLMERIGDGLVFVADRAAPAVDTALRLRALVACTPRFPRLRAGVHTGPVVRDGERYVGHALNVAARVTEHAAPGQVLCTEAVATEATDLPAVRYRSLGAVHFRHLVRPVVLYEVIGGGIRDTNAIDPVCRRQVDPTSDIALSRDGRRYVFCSVECRDAFARHPGDYVAP
jgi:adenylate cyclase